MNIQESINLFKQEYPALVKEGEDLNQQILSVFEKKLDEITPIISLMKEHDFYFFHPELDKEIKTTHGVILGRNLRNHSELFVFNGSQKLIIRVNSYDDKTSDGSPLSLKYFFQICDLDFAIKGINHVKNYLPELLKELKSTISTKSDFVQKYM